MLPIKQRIKPMINPPPPTRLIIENIRTITEPILTLFLSPLLIIMAPTMDITPKTIAITPKTIIMAPKPGRKMPTSAPPAVNIAATTKPFIRISIAPMRDNTNAAVGFSPKLFTEQFLIARYILNLLRLLVLAVSYPSFSPFWRFPLKQPFLVATAPFSAGLRWRI
jgi:hypothetical protein